MRKFNHEFFRKIGFKEVKQCSYTKDDGINTYNFRVFETTNMGTNIEYRFNDELVITGYWVDQNDFETTFRFK